MKKFVLLLCVCVLSFSLVACSSSKEEPKKDDATIQDVELTKEQRELALAFTKDIFENHFDVIKKSYSFDKNMMDVIQKDSFAQQMQSFTKPMGKISSYKEPYGQSYQGKTSIFVPVVSKNNKCNIQLTMNDKNEIIGLFVKNYKEKESEKAPDGVKEIDLQMKLENGGRIAGKLTLPDQDGTYPAIVMLSGSGPNDMNEHVGNQKPFQTLAWELAKQGVATYRFDKRTLENVGTMNDTVQQEYVEDALSALELVQQQKQIDTKKIYLLGHSQGGYVIPMIAKETQIPAGYILMSAPARALEESILEQTQYLANLDGVISADEKLQIAAIKKDYKALKEIDKANTSTTYFGLSRAYMMALKDYDPITTAKRIEKPVLVTQGLRDYQVTKTDLKRWETAFKEKKNWTFKTYPNANHLMSDGKGTPSYEEYDKNLKMNEDFIEDIATFVK